MLKVKRGFKPPPTHESSEGLSSMTIPKSTGIPPSACLGTPSLSTLQRAEPPRCLALRTSCLGVIHSLRRGLEERVANIHVPVASLPQGDVNDASVLPAKMYSLKPNHLTCG